MRSKSEKSRSRAALVSRQLDLAMDFLMESEKPWVLVIPKATGSPMDKGTGSPKAAV